MFGSLLFHVHVQLELSGTQFCLFHVPRTHLSSILVGAMKLAIEHVEVFEALALLIALKMVIGFNWPWWLNELAGMACWEVNGHAMCFAPRHQDIDCLLYTSPSPRDA